MFPKGLYQMTTVRYSYKIKYGYIPVSSICKIYKIKKIKIYENQNNLALTILTVNINAVIISGCGKYVVF